MSEIELKLGEVYKSGRDNNLSAFGVNAYDWQILRIENKKKNATIFLNDVAVYELNYKKDFGKIVGIIYTFNGPGSVDFIHVKNLEGETIYSDDFDQLVMN